MRAFSGDSRLLNGISELISMLLLILYFLERGVVKGKTEVKMVKRVLLNECSG